MADENGTPSILSLIAFSSSATQGYNLAPGEWDVGIFNITSSSVAPPSFIMPRTGTVKNIYAMFNNNTTLMIEQGAIVQPFVCLATSSDGLNYTIQHETEVLLGQYAGTVNPRTVRRASIEDIDFVIPEGTIVVVVGGIYAQNNISPVYGDFAINGGIYIE